MKKVINLNTFFVALFGIAFGLVECAVVVYIRAQYYPDGFSFPLHAISHDIIITELWREAATILMLIAVGYLAGKTRPQRFAYFLISFAVWDIFYYIFLKLFINWPESLMTWDILFLLPVVWIGPVIAPVLLSLLMIALASLLLYYNKKLKPLELILLISGSIISIVSFMIDYLSYVSKHSHLESAREIANLSLTYVPESYNWVLFAIAVKLILGAMVIYFIRNKNRKIELANMQMF